MAEFPQKPKNLKEHEWYRQIEKDITLAVISADANDGTCSQCGQRRVIYQAQAHPSREIVSRCKDCCLALAGGSEHLWVRTEEALRKKWRVDAKDTVKAALASARWTKPDRGRSASSADQGSREGGTL